MVSTGASGNKIYYFESVEKTSESKVNAHYHEWFEVYFLTYGKCNYFIDNKSYKLNAGDIVLIPDGMIHKTNYSTPTHSRMLINCSGEYVPSSIYEAVKKGAYVFRSTSDTKEIEEIFRQIKNEYAQEDEFSNDALLTYLAYLFISIFRRCLPKEDGIHEVTCAEMAVNYIKENYMSKVTLIDTARYCSVSSEHLSRTFKKHTGVGFSEYLNIFRLNKAEDMLINQPGLSVSDIAFRCGFNDSNYFSNVFKKAYGMTPSEKKKGKK